MNAPSFFSSSLALLLGITALCSSSCKPSANPQSGAGGASSSRDARADRVPVEAVTVEVRPDGLGYLPGADKPFTGNALTPFPDAPWLVKKTEPWTNGRRNGEVRELFKNGDTKTLRRYENGLPKYASAYHKNGQMKFEIQLNATDRAEGPYRRWYDNGKIECEAGFDAEERWHGVSKEWTKEGVLKSHLVFDHGALKEIVFENEEGKAARVAHGVELESPAPKSDPAAGPPDSKP